MQLAQWSDYSENEKLGLVRCWCELDWKGVCKWTLSSLARQAGERERETCRQREGLDEKRGTKKGWRVCVSICVRVQRWRRPICTNTRLAPPCLLRTLVYVLDQSCLCCKKPSTPPPPNLLLGRKKKALPFIHVFLPMAPLQLCWDPTLLSCTALLFCS